MKIKLGAYHKKECCFYGKTLDPDYYKYRCKVAMDHLTDDEKLKLEGKIIVISDDTAIYNPTYLPEEFEIVED